MAGICIIIGNSGHIDRLILLRLRLDYNFPYQFGVVMRPTQSPDHQTRKDSYTKFLKTHLLWSIINDDCVPSSQSHL